MAYVGNTVTTQGFIPAIDYFNGDGSTTAFILSRPVASVAQVQVWVNNVNQLPGTAFTVSGNTITFTGTPSAGTNNIYVYYISPITQVIAPSQGTVSSTSFASSTGSGAVVLATSPTITTPTLSGDTTAGTINGLTVGKGSGSVATNTAVGASALASNTTGLENIAVGYQSAYSNTTGFDNTAIGYTALYSNQTGRSSCAYGVRALYTSTVSDNAAFGVEALYSNTTGLYNFASGPRDASGNAPLYANTTGSYNIGVGAGALKSNTTASNNTAVGYQAGYSANGTTGSQGGYNTFVGRLAGYSLTTGYSNTLIGQGAGYLLTTGSLNTFIGSNSDTNSSGQSMTTGSKNSIFGNFSGNQGGLNITTSSNYIVLSDGDGNPRLWSDGSGNIVAPQVYNNTTPSGANAFFAGNGTFQRSTSSLKYKTNVQDATHGLADLLKLRSVTYQSKNPEQTGIFGGLIAEEVDAAGLTEFVQYAEDGSPDALSYGNMVALCVKAIQELKAIVDAQAVEIAELKAQK